LRYLRVKYVPSGDVLRHYHSIFSLPTLEYLDIDSACIRNTMFWRIPKSATPNTLKYIMITYDHSRVKVYQYSNITSRIPKYNQDNEQIFIFYLYCGIVLFTLLIFATIRIAHLCINAIAT
jgi:hypothetical protein